MPLPLELSEEYLSASRRHLPEGMLQVLADAYLQAQETANFSAAMKARYAQAQELPLAPAIKDMYAAVAQAQTAVAEAAGQIAPVIERIHERELDRLRNPRDGEELWDVRANRGAA